MSDTNETGVKFTADTSAVVAGMSQAAGAVKSGVGEMREHYGKLNESFGMITKGFGLVFAAMAGGKAFKEFVSDAVAVTKESMGLGKALGITATEASVLRSALAATGVSQDAVATAGKRLSLSMATGGVAIEALGVATKDSNGHFKDSEAIMLEVNSKLAEFKEGTDRNIEGVKIYGRAWSEVSPMIGRIDTSGLEKARERATELNLVVGQESVAAVKAYGMAQRESKEVMEGVNRTVGEALLPRLTALGQWFAEIGPAAVEATRGIMATYLVIQDSVSDSAKALWSILVDAATGIGKTIREIFGDGGEAMGAMEFFRNVLRVVQIAFIGFRVAIQVSCELIKGFLNGLMSALRTFADVAVAALHLDWAGVKAAWTDGTARSEKILADSMGRMVEIARKGGADIEAAAMGSPTAAKKVTAIEKKPGGKDSAEASDGGGKDKEKADKRLAEWKASLQDRKEADKDYFKDSTEADLKVWQDHLATVGTVSEKDKTLRRSVNTEIFNLNRQLATQNRALSDEELAQEKKMGDATVARHRQDADDDLALGKITEAQKLAIYKQAEMDSFNLDVSRITGLSRNYETDKLAYQKYQDELKAIKVKHDNDMAKLNTEALLAEKKQVDSMLAPITSAISTSVKAMISGTTSMQKGLSNIFKAIGLEFVNSMVKKMVEGWLAGEVRKLAASNASFAALMGLNNTTATATVTTKVKEATAVVNANAAEGASGAAASQAAIPIVGPGLAVGAFASISALIMGAMGSISGFAVGSWDVPGDMFTKVHKGETIVPAQFAEKFRDGGTGGGVVNLHVHANDAQSVARLFRDNGEHIVAALQKQRRNMAF